jgi:hypothetical protein
MVKKNGAWGYIDQKGNWAIPPSYKNVTNFCEEGFAAVITKSSDVIIIDKTGKEVDSGAKHFGIVDGYAVNGFKNGLLVAQSLTTMKWGLMDVSGRWLVPAKYKSLTEFNDGAAIGESGGNFFILNSKGEESPIKIVRVKVIKNFSEGLAPFCTRKGCGFINTMGNQVIPDNFQTVGYFAGGLAWARNSNGRIGFIDTNGNWVIQPQYSAVSDFDPATKVAKVKLPNSIAWIYISDSGEVLNINNTSSSGDFSEGLCYGKTSDGLVGFFDKDGKWIIEPRFKAVRNFKNGYAAAREDVGWGIIDKQGNWIVQPLFEGIRDMEKVK